ncbi:MAG TPA: MFS transporter [Gaiellaceae bacterium]|nr:MFS transporter [Gaiellaceae bacterium]
MAVDTRPLRSSQAFRRLWFGTGISAIGSQITTVAIPIQVYAETKSTFLVGLLGLAALVPLLTVSLVAGAIADAVDRRRLLLLSDVALALVTVLLIGNAMLDDPNVPALFVLEGLATAAYAFQRPARNALTPKLVRDDELLAAIAVEDVVFNLSRVAGPALAGLLIAVFGFAGAYAFDLATFAASLVSIWLLPRFGPIEGADRPSLRSIAEGFRFVRKKPALLGIFTVDTNAMIFGMPSALFPAFAEDLGGGDAIVGLLYAAPSAGAFLASVVSGWMTRVDRQGLGVCVAAAAWGIAIGAVGLVTTLPLALFFLACAGAADFISAVLRSTIMLQATPDAMRGRMSGIELAQVAGAPALGNLEAGVVASLVGLRFSIVSGGIATVVGTVAIAAALPAFRRYRRPT